MKEGGVSRMQNLLKSNGLFDPSIEAFSSDGIQGGSGWFSLQSRKLLQSSVSATTSSQYNLSLEHLTCCVSFDSKEHSGKGAIVRERNGKVGATASIFLNLRNYKHPQKNTINAINVPNLMLYWFIFLKKNFF